MHPGILKSSIKKTTSKKSSLSFGVDKLWSNESLKKSQIEGRGHISIN